MSTNSSRFATYREITGKGARVFRENADNTEGSSRKRWRTFGHGMASKVLESSCWPKMKKIPMIIEELYDALIEAGVSDDKAQAAARVNANFDTRILEIKSEVNLLKWMVGFNLALMVAVLFRVFS